MEDSKTRQCVFIFLFWILVPSIDQYTDLRLVSRLLSGPEDDLNITSYTFFPFIMKHSGQLKDLGPNIQTTYKKAYEFVGVFMMLPILMSTFFTLVRCLSIEKNSSSWVRLVTALLSIVGLYPQYRASRTILTAYGKIEGDWIQYRDESKALALIEPVTEGLMQLFCQTVILYTVQGPGEIFQDDTTELIKPLDLHDLIYHDTVSMITYNLLLITSTMSVGISFAKMLVSGPNPVISSVVSFQFFKILVMTISKFMVQSYFLAVIVKSLLYNFINKYQFDPPLPDHPDIKYLVETYYKGLCVPSRRRDEFCDTELLSFTLASLYAPLILIFILYLPTIFYLSFLSAKFYGLKNCVRGFLDDPIYYVFPFFTNISFFQQNEKSLRKKSDEEEGEGSMESSLLWKGLVETTTGVIMLKNISQNQLESDDVEADDDADEVTEDVFDQDQDNQIVEANNQEDPQTDETQSKRTKTVSVSSNNQRQAENVHEFSLYQSNVLYALFLLGFASSIGFDVAVQVARKWDKVRDKWYVVAISTKIALSVLALNTLLWLDFVREFLRTRKNPISQTNQTLGWIQELINFTTNSLICCFLIPILAIRRHSKIGIHDPPAPSTTPEA